MTPGSDEELGFGDLAGEPLPPPGTLSALAKLSPRLSSPEVTVAGDPEDEVDVAED